jgi:polyribonucleotide nucleotidyltransferase
MEAKVPIQVRLVEGTHLSKLWETGNETHILPTCTEGKPETENLRQVLRSTANEKIPAHLAELIDQCDI